MTYKTLILAIFCFFLSNILLGQSAKEEMGSIEAIEKKAAELAEEQLKAYNARDIEAFLKPYSDSVKIFYFRQGMSFEGKKQMREIYSQLFENTPDLHCKIATRIVQGSTVIDHEIVTFKKGEEIRAVAIYVIKHDKIQEVHFVRRE